MKRLLLLLIRVYQRTLSPLLGDCCRFEPSCSRYATLCLQHHGTFKGTLLTLKRLLRCNPLFAGGVDLPPLPPSVDPVCAEPDWERVSRLCSCEHRVGHALSRNRQMVPQARISRTTPSDGVLG